MSSRASDSPARRRLFRRLEIAILVVGFASAILIYVLATPPGANPLGYEPLENRSYVRDLELYGGKWNILAEEFRNWFVGLWHGKTLAFTVGVITLALALALRLFTMQPPAPVSGRKASPD